MSKRERSVLTRRTLLRLGLTAAGGLALPGAGPRLLRAQAPSSRLMFALLDHGPGSNPRPTALRRLAWEVVKRTSIEAGLDQVVLPPESPELFRHPFMVLAGADALPPPAPAAASLLRRHLTYGGTLLIDRTEGDDGSPFDVSVREWLGAVLPGQALAPVPRKHVLYKSFYLVDAPTGRAVRKSYLEGVTVDGRLAVVYSHNDLLGAWARDDLGMWTHDVEPRQRELAFRLGINLVMYAMTLDYKDDQVHLPFILKRRKS